MDEIVAAWPRHALDISGYDLEQRLPAGQYSAVFLATDRSSNRRVLVRHLAPIDATDAFLPVYRSEISVAARCRSSFVLPFIGFTTRPPYALVFESCRPACVADLLRQGRLAPAQKHGIARAVASALRDIHDGGLVHGDVTAASVVLTDDGAPKLCLNRSSLVESEPSPFAFPGAANYYATERFATGHATKLSDVFSYGVLVWELLNEETPFNRLAAVQIASSAVLRRRLPLAPESPATAIMRGCLAEPQLRWSAAQLIARLESYDSIFPEESQEPGIKLVKEATAKLEGVLGSEYLEWISNLSQDLERAIAFMPICVDLIAQSQNKVICKNAIFALLHLLHKKTELVDKFVELALPDKLLIDKPYLAKEILSLCSIVFTSHPESASPLLIRQGLSFSDICPIKVLEFCAVLCHSFTKDRISWEIIDSLFLNADLYLSLHLGEQLCGLIYLLIVRFSIFCQERSRPVVSFFVKCRKSFYS
jgi:serine/threonine protein kinase